MGKVSEEKTERNAEIYRRRMSGEMPTALGKAYDVTPNRIYKIVRTQQKKQDVSGTGKSYGDCE